MARYWRVVGPRRLAPAVVIAACCLISACGAGAAKDAVDLLTTKYTVGGSVSGTSGSGLVLQDNGADSLAISANGSFTFEHRPVDPIPRRRGDSLSSSAEARVARLEEI